MWEPTLTHVRLMEYCRPGPRWRRSDWLPMIDLLIEAGYPYLSAYLLGEHRAGYPLHFAARVRRWCWYEEWCVLGVREWELRYYHGPLEEVTAYVESQCRYLLLHQRGQGDRGREVDRVPR